MEQKLRARHAGIGRGTLLTRSSTPPSTPLTQNSLPSPEAMSSMAMDWGQTLESLAGFLSTAR